MNQRFIRRRPCMTRLVLIILLVVAARRSCRGQPGWFEGQRWSVRRPVTLSAEPPAGAVCVIEFLCHGQLNETQPNLRVVANGESMPHRVLQRGPADHVRLAFLASAGQTRYEVYYGGTASAPPPAWNSPHGLLFEARRYRECDLSRLDSVRDAFAEAPPLGADFVANVFLGYLPFADSATPVLARFHGRFRVAQEGKHRFYTSSRDASWLLIDGKSVVGWPGRHGPSGQGRHFGDVELEQGLHELEYYNAAPEGGLLCVAAWQPPGSDKITPLPEDAFGRVLSGKVGNPELRLRGVQPDFAIQTLAEAALGPDLPRLLRVRFVPGIGRGPYRWDFGDGQSAIAERPEHVYLLPGEYRVQCTRTASRAEIVHRIHVAPPWSRLTEQDAQADVADWLPELKRYDPTSLPADSLLQLIRVLHELEEDQLAVDTARAGLTRRTKDSPPLEAQDAARAALTASHILDRVLNVPEDAIDVCDVGLRYEPVGAEAVRLWVDSAELALQQGKLQDAQQRLLQAKALSSETLPEDVRRQLAVAQGDAARRMRQPDAARRFYRVAQQLSDSAQWDIRRHLAIQGVHSRAVEDALREGRPRAADDELRQWVDEMPECKADGYYSLLRARCDLTRNRYAAAIHEAEDLLAIAPESPYADRLLLVAAEAHSRNGNVAESREFLERLLQVYPGSPEVPQARKLLQDGFPNR